MKVSVLLLSILLNSCKPDKPINPLKPLSDEMYIQFNGLKVICKVPTVLSNFYINYRGYFSFMAG
jgi:hypothetical protein